MNGKVTLWKRWKSVSLLLLGLTFVLITSINKGRMKNRGTVEIVWKMEEPENKQEKKSKKNRKEKHGKTVTIQQKREIINMVPFVAENEDYRTMINCERTKLFSTKGSESPHCPHAELHLVPLPSKKTWVSQYGSILGVVSVMQRFQQAKAASEEAASSSVPFGCFLPWPTKQGWPQTSPMHVTGGQPPTARMRARIRHLIQHIHCPSHCNLELTPHKVTTWNKRHGECARSCKKVKI